MDVNKHLKDLDLGFLESVTLQIHGKSFSIKELCGFDGICPLLVKVYNKNRTQRKQGFGFPPTDFNVTVCQFCKYFKGFDPEEI